MAEAIILAAPNSGSGKTMITLGILRTLRDRGLAVRAAKSGPDYIDPQFHLAASGSALNLDPWAMAKGRLRALAGDGLLVIEGAMGLFDGAADGSGSTADLAKMLRAPVVLIVDCASLSGSVAPLVAGFARFDPEVHIAGVVLNRIGSPRHERLLRQALASLGLPVLGAVPRDTAFHRPSRHLGLVQAEEHADLESFIAGAAALIARQIDLDALIALAHPTPKGDAPRLKPPGQRIAIAKDQAFAFLYPHLVADWRAQGAEISFFSPLADEGPDDADFIYLPGGYPELHAARLSANQTFMQKMRYAAQGALIYGECGGYMVLGEGLTDADGKAHQMLGLLPLETSFQHRKLQLGYRHLTTRAGPFQGHWKGHEFHYATTIRAEGTPLFEAEDAEGIDLPAMGLIKANVMGSFAHLIDLVPAKAKA
jgi:cobyrinic acid a,c-diamide synthase